MGALMERLGRALEPLMGVPFGLFGHSVGAFMAFEAARQLRSVDGRDGSYEFPPLSAAGMPPKRRRIASKSRSDGSRVL
jgi:surfactin synthase thioesterase subunit